MSGLLNATATAGMVVTRADGTPFFESSTTLKWYGVDKGDVVGVERVLHNAQGTLIDWAEAAAQAEAALQAGGA